MGKYEGFWCIRSCKRDFLKTSVCLTVRGLYSIGYAVNVATGHSFLPEHNLQETSKTEVQTLATESIRPLDEVP